MKLNQKIAIAAAIVVAVLFCIFVYNELKRRAIISFSKEIISEVTRDIARVQALGFAPTSATVCALNDRAHVAQARIEELSQYGNVLLQQRVEENQAHERLQQALATYKQLLQSSFAQVERLREQGYADTHRYAVDVRERMELLVLAIRDIEQQIQIGTADSSTHSVDRLIAFDTESMKRYVAVLDQKYNTDPLDEQNRDFIKRCLSERCVEVALLQSLK